MMRLIKTLLVIAALIAVSNFISCKDKHENLEEMTINANEAVSSQVSPTPIPEHTLTIEARGRTAKFIADAMQIQLSMKPGIKTIQGTQIDGVQHVLIQDSGDKISVTLNSASQQHTYINNTTEVWNITNDIITHLTLSTDIDTPTSEISALWVDAQNALEQLSQDSAISNFKSILKEDENFIPAWIGLAGAYLNTFDTTPHTVWLNLGQEAAIRVKDSGHPAGMTALAQFAFRRGDWLEAANQLKIALKRYPFNFGARHCHGRLLLRAAFYQEAQLELTIALELIPGDAAVLCNLGWSLLGQGKNTEAMNTLKLITNPDDKVRAGLAVALCRLARGTQALNILGNTENSDILTAIKVNCLIILNKKDKALGLLETVIVPHVMNDPGIAMAAAAAYSQLGRPGEAIKMLRKADAAGYDQYPWIESDPFMKGILQDERAKEFVHNIKIRWQEAVEVFKH